MKKEWTEQQIQVMEAAMEEFNEKGLKFTMDDVARRLSMSKKTIYTIFADKEALFLAMVDYAFDAIKESEEAVLRDETLSIPEKIARIMIVLPDRYNNINLSMLYGLRDKYPKIYKKVAQRLEGDWESTISLLEQGMKEGSIRKVNIPILKMMFEASIEQFFASPILVNEGLKYEDALKKLMDIILHGIVEETD